MEGDDETRRWLRQYASDRDLIWPEIVAGADRTDGPAAEYAVRGIPYNVLLDREGRVAAVDVHGPRLDVVIGSLLERPVEQAATGGP